MAMRKDLFAALYATVDDPDVLIMSSNGVQVRRPTKSRIAHRIVGGNHVDELQSAYSLSSLGRCSLAVHVCGFSLGNITTRCRSYTWSLSLLKASLPNPALGIYASESILYPAYNGQVNMYPPHSKMTLSLSLSTVAAGE
jgi:hypothetical protein